MISHCTLVKALTDESLRLFLEVESEELQKMVTKSDLAKLGEIIPKMDMSTKSTQGWMKLFFMEYKLLLQINGLKRVTEKAPKTEVHCIL